MEPPGVVWEYSVLWMLTSPASAIRPSVSWAQVRETPLLVANTLWAMCWMRLNSSMSDWSGADRTCRGRAALNSPRTSQPPGARALEVVAFLDEQVEPVEERVDVGARQAVVEHRHGQVRVDLGDPPGRDPRLRGADIVH